MEKKLVEAQRIFVRAGNGDRAEYKGFLDAGARKRRVQHGYTVVLTSDFLA